MKNRIIDVQNVKITISKEELDEFLELLNSYSNTQDGDFDFLKSTYEKYNKENEDTNGITLDSNAMTEISSRLYKATLNATKKYYDINDFYIYYKDQLVNATTSTDYEEFENEVRMTTIKEYTIANIYKNAYNDSFISKIIASIENSSSGNEEISQEKEEQNTSENTNVIENNNSTINNNTSDNTSKNEDSEINEDKSDESYEEYLELTEALKSQIYDAGVNCAIDFIGQNITTLPSQYCRDLYEALENDNPLGDNKEKGYNSFLEGFKTTLENNNIEFN